MSTAVIILRLAPVGLFLTVAVLSAVGSRRMVNPRAARILRLAAALQLVTAGLLLLPFAFEAVLR